MHQHRYSSVPYVVLALLFVAFAGPAFATTAVVGNCAVGFSYPTISAAVAGSPAGATIDICPGTYPEQVLITKNLKLTGIQSGTSGAVLILPPSGGLVQNGVDIFNNPVAAQIFVQGASDVIITNLVVDGTGNNLVGCGGPTLEGIYFQNSSGAIEHSVVRNQYQTNFAADGGCQNGLAINIESLNSSNTVTVDENSVSAYQKNGITATGAGIGAGSPGPAVKIESNHIVGLAATAMNWPGGAAENGVQIGFGATGSVSSNTVDDNIWFQDTISQPGNAASGILVYSSDGITITYNRVNSAQFGITVDTDPTYGPADGNTISHNQVTGTQIFDAIDLCSSSNNTIENSIFGAAESAVHIDDSCGSGNSNTVSGNTITESCAGVLLGTGSGNSVGTNTYYGVTNTTLGGDVCPAPTPGATSPNGLKTASAKHARLRPSPFLPHKN
jgi:hypothetical protein